MEEAIERHVQIEQALVHHAATWSRWVLRRKRCEVILMTAMLLGACTVAVPEQRLTASEFGSEWPFTVDTITVRCGDPQRRHVVFEAQGIIYALNGSARGSSQVRDGIWQDGDQVRKVDSSKAAQPDIFDRPYANLPVSFIEIGLKLCDSQR